jgi:hypothetical protein
VQIPGKVGDSPCIGTQDGNWLEHDLSNTTDVLSRGYVCDLTNGIHCKAGTCVSPANAGAPCTTDSDCVTSAFCDSLQGKCTIRVAAGGHCDFSSSAACVDGDYCDNATQQCTAKLATGAPCSDFIMCQSGSCSETCQPAQPDPFGTLALSLICGS